MATAEELTKQQRAQWSAAAAGWERRDGWFEQQSQDLSGWLCDAAGIGPGMRTLDVACGAGEPAATAARRVAPGGRVTAIDLSPDMVAVTRRKVVRLGLDHVEAQEMDVQALSFADDTFDAATCRFGLMFCPDPVRGAAEIRRVLKPGARFATAVWDVPARNPFFTSIAGVLAEFVPMPPPDPSAPGVFRLAPPGELRACPARRRLFPGQRRIAADRSALCVARKVLADSDRSRRAAQSGDGVVDVRRHRSLEGAGARVHRAERRRQRRRDVRRSAALCLGGEIATCCRTSSTRFGGSWRNRASRWRRCCRWPSASAPTRRLFSVTSALLLRPLPYKNADRLVILWQRSPGLNIAEDWFSTAQYFDIKNGHSGFEQVAIAIGGNYALTGRGDPERIGVIRVSSNLLPMLGAQPAVGRLFTPEEDSPGPACAAVLGHGTWARRYGLDPRIVGTSITLNGEPCRIVGVLQARFSLPREVLPTLGVAEEGDVYLTLPLPAAAAGRRDREDYNVIGTLKPGVTVAAAQAEMDLITARLRQEHPQDTRPTAD